jgi:hypothetical protein
MLVSFSVQDQNLSHLEEGNLKRDSPAIYKGLDAITSSLSQIGGTIGKSLEVSFDIIFFADVYIYIFILSVVVRWNIYLIYTYDFHLGICLLDLGLCNRQGCDYRNVL